MHVLGATPLLRRCRDPSALQQTDSDPASCPCVSGSQGDVEGKGFARPPWLGFAVHVLNSIAAWGDLAVSRCGHTACFHDAPWHCTIAACVCADATTNGMASCQRCQVDGLMWLAFPLQLGHPRTFSKRSSRICLGIASFYLCWILVCSHFNGVFPYPFLNKMPWPQASRSRATQ